MSPANSAAAANSRRLWYRLPLSPRPAGQAFAAATGRFGAPAMTFGQQRAAFSRQPGGEREGLAVQIREVRLPAAAAVQIMLHGVDLDEFQQG
jgi:hypothetical protein